MSDFSARREVGREQLDALAVLNIAHSYEECVELAEAKVQCTDN